MSVTRHVHELVISRLNERRVVVWYDPDHAFHDLFESLDHQPLVKVDASTSVLRARRDADRAWRALFDIDSLGPAPAPILV